VTQIHGGMKIGDRDAPGTRLHAEREFRDTAQVLVATEAAGEGINLQFCWFMINYDIPWNPVRLEQRMGRIHRIGQDKTCVIFNFCAENTVEGKLLTRLLEKLEEMRAALGGRVYDVVGDLLARNGVDFERLLRETLLNPTRIDPAQLEIEGLSAEVYKDYEQMIGVAQATKNVDMSWVKERDWCSEERRLMPEYVEQFFGRACDQLSVKLDRRADGLWRIEHVPQTLRSPDHSSRRSSGSAARSRPTASSRSSRRTAPSRSTRTRCCSRRGTRCMPRRWRRCC
jgi:superfamily II DNA/RNA helicase